MINHLIEWSLRNRFLVVGLTLLLIGAGIRAMWSTPVDALPDLSENQVIVSADWMGRGPQEVEAQVTQPLSLHLQGLGGIKSVRATSMFGFALVNLIFEDSVSSESARQRVLERLNALRGKLPAGVAPTLGPDATGLGWVYQYYLAVDPAMSGRDGYDLGSLRALQDSFVRPQLSSVAGVAEVGSVGGFVKQYQIEVDSAKMRNAGVSLTQVMDAVSQSNLNVGGKTIEENGMEFIVRGVGLLHGPEEIENLTVAEQDDKITRLQDVARVELGGDFRRGTLDVMGHEVVGGTVVMRLGENASAVIQRVKTKVEQLQASLPEGVRITAFYDRSELIDRTIATLRSTLRGEILLVTLAHILFLFHFRSILIVILPLPVSILISFILMRQVGISSNLMSLSGIAIAIGVLVDAAIVITENVIRHCEQATVRKGSALTTAETWQTVLVSAQQVGRPIFFAMAIIILAFVPVFALTGVEGKLFHPLAFTKTFAMIGSTLLAVTIVPVLCTWLVRGPFHAEERNVVMRGMLRLYDPVLEFALSHRKFVLGCAGIVLLGALSLIPQMGREFMPPLNEGSLLYMPSYVPATALSEVKRAMAWQDQVLATFPEVQSAVGKLGRVDTATDPAPIEMIETTIMLKPESAWREGMTREKLVAEMTAAMRQIPGSVPGFLQPIEGRVLMISTGIRAQLGVKIFGNNLEELQRAAASVQQVVQLVPGAMGVASSRIQGKPYLEIRVNREAANRYGLSAQQVLDAVEVGIGGKEVTSVIDGRNRIPVQVRLQRSEREDLTRLQAVLVTSATGKVVPLGVVAEIVRVEGPNEISSEYGRLRAYVQANVSGRDLGGFVEEVKSKLATKVLPSLAAKGMTLEYSGTYENQIHAASTLRWIVPTVLGIIFLLLLMLYRKAAEAAHVLLAVPFALSGGVMLQYALGWNFSVAVWVGYIALFGTAIQTAVVMVVYLEEAVEHKRKQLGCAFTQADLKAAVIAGARLRLRPKVMTVATIVASLLPIMWSHGPGAEVMRPLATPILGGMVSSLIHILVVTPVLFVWLHGRKEAFSAPAQSYVVS